MALTAEEIKAADEAKAAELLSKKKAEEAQLELDNMLAEIEIKNQKARAAKAAYRITDFRQDVEKKDLLDLIKNKGAKLLAQQARVYKKTKILATEYRGKFVLCDIKVLGRVTRHLINAQSFNSGVGEIQYSIIKKGTIEFREYDGVKAYSYYENDSVHVTADRTVLSEIQKEALTRVAKEQLQGVVATITAAPAATEETQPPAIDW